MDNLLSKNGFVFDLFEDMQRNNLNYIYRGFFTQSITDNIILLTEANMNSVVEDSKIKKRVFTILVEGLQNVTRHQEIDGKEASPNQSGIFIIQNQDERYYITTGNPILKANIPKLTRQLEKINSLSPDDLKKFYKEVLNDNVISDKGGAGLGLIEMARKSGNKLDYDFSEINDNYSYFYMGTTVVVNEETAPAVPAEKCSMDAIKAIHKTINEQDIIIIFNGLHTQDSLLHIISIMEEHLMNKDVNFRKKMIYCIVELLQNIVKHGKKDTNATKGVFFISNSNNEYQLNTVNYIPNSNVEQAKKALERVNQMSESELNEFYDNNLAKDENIKDGLGLTEMRLRTQHKINYLISPVDDKISAIFIQVTI